MRVGLLASGVEGKSPNGFSGIAGLRDQADEMSKEEFGEVPTGAGTSISGRRGATGILKPWTDVGRDGPAPLSSSSSESSQDILDLLGFGGWTIWV